MLVRVLALAAAVVALAWAGAGASVPAPLHGVPCEARRTSGSSWRATRPTCSKSTRVEGRASAGSRSVASPRSVSSPSAATRSSPSTSTDQGGFAGAAIYILRHGGTRATRLATAWEVGPAADGSAVWLKSYVDKAHCALRELALDRRERTPGREIPCSSHLVDSGSGAFLVDGTSVLDPGTGRTVVESGNLWAVAGDVAITLESYHPAR
jgi:hypothetical protein